MAQGSIAISPTIEHIIKPNHDQKSPNIGQRAHKALTTQNITTYDTAPIIKSDSSTASSIGQLSSNEAILTSNPTYINTIPAIYKASCHHFNVVHFAKSPNEESTKRYDTENTNIATKIKWNNVLFFRLI